MSGVVIRALTDADREQALEVLCARWGSAMVVVHEQVYCPHALPGFVAVLDQRWVGVLTYVCQRDYCEVVTLDSFLPRHGVGRALLVAAQSLAHAVGCVELRVTTTNDNLVALRLYQRYGFVLTQLRPGAVLRARQVKPEIPLIGFDAIPLRDEIDLVLPLV